jgi:hypothetical protein
MEKLKKLAELNSLIDKIVRVLEAKIFINTDIPEDTDSENKITETENDKK